MTLNVGIYIYPEVEVLDFAGPFEVFIAGLRSMFPDITVKEDIRWLEMDDFKTGWYGIKIYIRGAEIDTLIEQLAQLKKNRNQHFHLSSDYCGEGGIGDISFSIQEDERDNMSVSGFAISPNR